MARLDTGWHNNPKVLRLSDKGMALHAWSISYCDAARSDGFIAQDAWPARFGRAVKELERASMWERCEGGYYLHDYLDYNRSRAYIDDYARAKREAGRAGGQASASARASPDGRAKRQQTVNQMLNEHLKQNPTPGPGVREFNDAAAAAVTPVRTIQVAESDPGARTRETAAAAAAATLKNLDEDLPDEVRHRLSQPPIVSHAYG